MQALMGSMYWFLREGSRDADNRHIVPALDKTAGVISPADAVSCSVSSAWSASARACVRANLAACRRIYCAWYSNKTTCVALCL